MRRVNIERNRCGCSGCGQARAPPGEAYHGSALLHRPFNQEVTDRSRKDRQVDTSLFCLSQKLGARMLADV